jgi:hypothetical protein
MFMKVKKQFFFHYSILLTKNGENSAKAKSPQLYSYQLKNRPVELHKVFFYRLIDVSGTHYKNVMSKWCRFSEIHPFEKVYFPEIAL